MLSQASQSDGSRIPENKELAARYLILAAKQDNPLAQLYLGDLFFEKMEGKLNYTFAADLYRKAVAGLERVEFEETKSAAASGRSPAKLDAPIGEIF